MKVLKAVSMEQRMGLYSVNMVFLLVFIFGYSPLSLVFLFISWLVLMGITLHLIFLATSEDDYQFKFSGKKVVTMAGSQNTSAKATAEVPLEERDEFIAPRTILKPLLKAYEIVLVLV